MSAWTEGLDLIKSAYEAYEALICPVCVCAHVCRPFHWKADSRDLLNLRHALAQLSSRPGSHADTVLIHIVDLLQHLPVTALQLQQTQICSTVKALRQVNPPLLACSLGP